MIDFGINNGVYKISIGLLNTGVIGKKASNIDYSLDFKTVRLNEKKLLNTITGIDTTGIAFLDQVHGDEIIVIDSPINNSDCIASADGMLTALNDICLVIRTADCVPVIAYDAKKNIVGAVHSGWKGCRLNISAKLLKMMNNIYSCLNEDIFVYMLPSIGPESYEVNEDVASQFTEQFIRRQNQKIYLNLCLSIEQSLLDLGVNKSNIYNSEICNYKKNDEFFSYRRRDIGRNLNFAYIKTSKSDNLF